MTDPHRDEALREAVRNALREMLPDVVGGQAATNGHAGVNGHAAANGQAAANGHAAANGSAPTDTHRPPRAAVSPGNEPEVVPLVPAPPVAAVLRPSTWSGPAVPGEVIGDGFAAAPAMPAQRPAAPAPQPGATAHAGAAPARPAPARPAPARPAPGARPIPDVSARPARPAPAGAAIETVTIDGDEDLQAFVRSLVTRLESPRDRLAIKAGRLRFRLQRSAGPAGTDPQQASPAMRVSRGAVTERHVREAHAEGSRLVLARAAVLTPLARETARSLGVQIERETQC